MKNKSNEIENSSFLKNLLDKLGIEVYGFADLKDHLDHIIEIPEDLKNKITYAVCIAFPLQSAVLETITNKPNKLYHRHYKMVNLKLDQWAVDISYQIEKRGYLGFPIPASLLLDWKTNNSHISHRAVAEQAGIGWRGKNNLLIHHKYKARLRFATILTDMPIVSDKPIKGNCSMCYKCIVNCPAEALDETGYNIIKCHEKLKQFAASEHVGLVCGICIKACG